MARPSKFKAEFIEQVKGLAAMGGTDDDAARFFGVAPSTLSLWKVTHPEFSEALNGWKLVADQVVERSLFQRAKGYSHEDTHFSAYEGVVTATPYIKHYPPDTTAGIFWLKNRDPERWRDVKAQEISGPNGEKLVVNIVKYGEGD